jgi:hypothetical protein
MLESSSSAGPWVSAGILLVIIGTLIKFRGWTFLVAGYDEFSSVPANTVANLAGNTILRIGIAALVLGGLIAITEITPYLPTVFGVIVLLDVARLIYRLNTYSPSNTA